VAFGVDDPVALDSGGGVLAGLADDVASWVRRQDLNYEVRCTRVSLVLAGVVEDHQVWAELVRARFPAPAADNVNIRWQYFLDECVKPMAIRWRLSVGNALTTSSPSMYSPRTLGPRASYSSQDIGIRSPGCIVSVAMSYTIYLPRPPGVVPQGHKDGKV
jgi:hypothetical protein